MTHALADPAQARARSDAEAPWYDGLTIPYQQFRELAVSRLSLRPGDVVLDVGCGTGLAFEALEERVGADGRIVGVDVSEAMLDEAFGRARRHGWDNIDLIEAPVEEAFFPEPGDAALFCATHDILQSSAALDQALALLRPGASVVAAGGKWADPWLIPLNLAVLAIHAPFVTTFAGFDRPWSQLARRLDDVTVEEVLWGTGFVLTGTKPWQEQTTKWRPR